MFVKLFGVLAIVIGAAVAVATLIGLLATPWVTIGMSLSVIALLVLHKRRPIRIRKGDVEVTLHHRAPDRDDW